MMVMIAVMLVLIMKGNYEREDEVSFSLRHPVMHLDSSSVMFSGTVRCYGSFKVRHPHPEGAARVDQNQGCVQLARNIMHGQEGNKTISYNV